MAVTVMPLWLSTSCGSAEAVQEETGIVTPVQVIEVIGAAAPVSSAVIRTVCADEYQAVCDGPSL